MALAGFLVAFWGCVGVSARAAESQSGRAYELVSPADKHGAQVGGTIPTVEATVAPDGDHVAYDGFFPLEGSSSGSFSGLLSSRASDGWRNTSLLPPPGANQIGGSGPGADAMLRGTTPDGRTGVYFDNTTSPFGSLWVVRADGSRVRIADASVASVGFSRAPLIGALPGQPWFEGISANGAHVVFADTDALVPGIVGMGNQILYEWSDDGSNGGQGSLSVVNRTNAPSLTLIDPLSGATLGGSATLSATREGGLRDAISADGSHIFFQTPPPVNGNGALPQGGGPLYAREDGTTTVQLSAPEQGYTPTSAPTTVEFLDASSRGRYVFFWANGDLTSGAPTTGGIYRYDTEASQLAFVAAAASTPNGIPTAMASADGSHLYFENGTTVDLYADGHVTPVFSGMIVDASVERAEGIRDDGCVTADVSSDGRYFAFVAEVDSGSPRQVYRYDATTEALEHVSVGPSAPATYDAGWLEAPSCALFGFPARVHTQVMSDDGQFVFFDTTAALVPEDNNQQSDVYEWHGGTVSLVSAGTSASGSSFVGTDVSGRDAFFTTTDALAPQDGDTNYDIYDARIGGGIPLPPGRTLCNEDACQPPQSPLPRSPSPASESLDGLGNVKASPVAGFDVGRLTAAAKKRLGKHGRLSFVVRTKARGTIRATLAIRRAGRWVSIGRARKFARRSGGYRVTVAATPRGRALLRGGKHVHVRLRKRVHVRLRKRVHVRLRVRVSGVARVASITFVVAGHRAARPTAGR